MPQTVKEAVAAARRTVRLEIADMIVKRPDLSYTQIGKVFSISWWTVQQVANEFEVRRGQGVGGSLHRKVKVPRGKFNA